MKLVAYFDSFINTHINYLVPLLLHSSSRRHKLSALRDNSCQATGWLWHRSLLHYEIDYGPSRNG